MIFGRYDLVKDGRYSNSTAIDLSKLSLDQIEEDDAEFKIEPW